MVDSPVNNKEQATLETTRVLFFAHDTITDREKRELPFKKFGGIYLPHIATLRDTKHMLYSCRLTQLPPFKMIGDWDMMLPPEARQDGGRWQRSFTQTATDATGQPKSVLVDGFRSSVITEEGEFKTRKSNHLIFTKRYPLHEARFALRRGGEHTPGGVVEIEALMGATAEEIAEAQYFFFPKWDEVSRGEEPLPSTTRALQDHLKARVDSIKDLPWAGEKKAKFYSIGNDMIRSSTEYDRTVKEVIRQDEIVQKASYAKGNTGAVNSVISEQYLEQTGSRRKDDIVSGQADSAGELAREMRAEREARASHEAKAFLLEERKQYTAEITAGLRERDFNEEVRLGMRKAETVVSAPFVHVVTNEPEATVSTATTSADYNGASTTDTARIDATINVSPYVAGTTLTDSVTRICGQPTNSGAPCQRTLRDDQEACAHHSK